MFNIITSDLPTVFMGVQVKTDFKQGLKFFNILNDEELDEREKALLVMKCLFFSSPPNTPDLWEFIQFYIGGGENNNNNSGEKVFDFIQDSGRVYAAFRQVYGLNLRSESMHWWEFLELFKNLPDGTMLAKVIEIRSREIDPKSDQKTKAKLMKLKSQFMLKTNETFKPSFY